MKNGAACEGRSICFLRMFRWDAGDGLLQRLGLFNVFAQRNLLKLSIFANIKAFL